MTLPRRPVVDLNDRMGYLVLGMLLGAILGYVARMLQDIKKDVRVMSHDVHNIKEEVDEIDTIVKRPRKRDESGIVRYPLAADILLVTVLALTFWAAYSTGETNNKLEKAVEDLASVQAQDEVQDQRLEKISQCTLQYTSRTIRALNERTQYTQAQANQNVKVLREQAKVFRAILLVPPLAEEQVRTILEDYVITLADFNDVAKKNKAQVTSYAYPTNKELANCLGVTLPEVESGEQER